jgi:hypothetical protein
MSYTVSRTRVENPTKNTVVLRRSRPAHISALLRSNSGAVPLANRPYRITLPGGELREGVTGADGLVEEPCLPPGDHLMWVQGLSCMFPVPTTPVHIRRRPLRVPGYLLIESEQEASEAGGQEQEEAGVQQEAAGAGESDAAGESEGDWEDLETLVEGGIEDD